MFRYEEIVPALLLYFNHISSSLRLVCNEIREFVDSHIVYHIV